MTPQPLTYGSVCSGIEAVSLAWKPLGWKPAWFSEIDPFPNAVLAHHYPDVPNLGDVTGLAARVRARAALAPDILVGGTPCQAFSVAGARQGLSDPRGALTLKYTELADAIDRTRQENGQPPAIVVWENVPGVLSDKSNAFGCLLGALAGESGPLEPAGRRWTNAGCVLGPRRRVAWRVLNAQYFGVAQRRRRVFLVASGRDDLDPAAVLFEPTGLPGDSSPGGQTREIAAGPTEGGADGAGGLSDALAGTYGKPSLTVCFGGGNRQGPIDRAACLTARGHKCDFEVETFAAQSITGERTHALNTTNGGKGSSEDGTGRGVPIVAHSVAFAENTRSRVRLEAGGAYRSQERHPFSAIAFSAKDHGGDALEDIAPTLRAGVRLNGNPNGGVMPAIAFRTLRATFQYDVSGTLISHYSKKPENADTILGPDLVARSVALRGRDGGATIEMSDGIATALRASTGGSDKAHVLLPSTEDYFHGQMLGPDETGWSQWAGWRVRRLMPVECERLQGMPDNYTLVPYRGKPAADGPRYKAIGNSMAVPCIEWLGRRIALVLEESNMP